MEAPGSEVFSKSVLRVYRSGMAKRTESDPAKALDASLRIVVLHGEEMFLREQYAAQLREALVKAHGEIDTIHFDGQSAKPADVLDECRSFGLIAAHKLIVVDNADVLVKEDARPLFESYAEHPSEGATLLLRCQTWRPGNLDKRIEAVGAIKLCTVPRLAGRDGRPTKEVDWAKLAGWAVVRAAKRYNAAVERDAAALLVERIGADMARIDSELAKLAAAAGCPSEGPPGAVGKALVAEFVGESREEEVWGIQRTVLTEGPEAALHHLRQVLEVSRQPPTLVNWALTDMARKLHAASSLLRAGANPFALKGQLRLFGDAADAILNEAKRRSPAQCRMLFEAAVDSDFRQKRGLGEPERTAECLVVLFSTQGRST